MENNYNIPKAKTCHFETLIYSALLKLSVGMGPLKKHILFKQYHKDSFLPLSQIHLSYPFGSTNYQDVCFRWKRLR